MCAQKITYACTLQCVHSNPAMVRLSWYKKSHSEFREFSQPSIEQFFYIQLVLFQLINYCSWTRTFCSGIQDSKIFFKYEIRQNLWSLNFLRQLGESTYINMACKNFLRIFNEFSEIYQIIIRILKLASKTANCRANILGSTALKYLIR